MELDLETAKTLCTAYEGYGDAVARWVSAKPVDSSMPEKGALIGGAYATAGIYCSLFDQKSAAYIFEKAAPFYRETNQPFWKLIALCSLARNEEVYSYEDSSNGSTPQDYFFDLMLRNFLGTDLDKWSQKYFLSHDQLKQWISRPVGRLGIPLGTYNALAENSEKSSFAMFSILAKSAEQA